MAKRSQEGLLSCVLCVRVVAQDGTGGAKHPLLVEFDEAAECRRIPGLGRRDQAAGRFGASVGTGVVTHPSERTADGECSSHGSHIMNTAREHNSCKRNFDSLANARKGMGTHAVWFLSYQPGRMVGGRAIFEFPPVLAGRGLGCTQAPSAPLDLVAVHRHFVRFCGLSVCDRNDSYAYTGCGGVERFRKDLCARFCWSSGVTPELEETTNKCERTRFLWSCCSQCY